MRGAIGLIVAGLVCYLGSTGLTWYYLEKRAPGLLQRSADRPPDQTGRRLWEHTSGQGIVPRWVSFIGLLGIPAMLLGASRIFYLWAR